MKILITGKNSYIGTSFEQWARIKNPKWQIDTIDVKDDQWKQMSFANYDSIFNVAAIVHQKSKSVDPSIYYKVNRDLALSLARKAKQDGVKQFVQMSTMAVYGLDGTIGKKVIIDKKTKCQPTSYYGKSKVEADEKLMNLTNNDFIVSIIRPPMVYGPNGVGNYLVLSKIVKRIRIFPKISNQRSMIYIDNLSEILMCIIGEKKTGIFHPHNSKYVSTNEMVKLIAEANGIKLYESRLMAMGVKVFGKYVGICGKVFGDLIYAHEFADIVKDSSNEIQLKESIYLIERS